MKFNFIRKNATKEKINKTENLRKKIEINANCMNLDLIESKYEENKND